MRSGPPPRAVWVHPARGAIGVYPETKHPTYFDGLKLSMDRPLLQTLARHGYEGRKAAVFIQSFEVGNLQRLRKKTRLPMVQLIEATGAPFDFVAAQDARTYADLITPAGLELIATYANAIGPSKTLIIPRTRAGLAGRAHVAGRGCACGGARRASVDVPRREPLPAREQPRAGGRHAARRSGGGAHGLSEDGHRWILHRPPGSRRAHSR